MSSMPILHLKRQLIWVLALFITGHCDAQDEAAGAEDDRIAQMVLQAEQSFEQSIAKAKQEFAANINQALDRAIDRAAGEEHHRLFVEDLDNPGTYGPYDTAVGDTSLMTVGTVTWTEPP